MTEFTDLEAFNVVERLKKHIFGPYAKKMA